ncbi:MAG: hypothetical protein DI533_19590 [Cereibacter sphaeroides]|uniref:Cupin domain-containing protein n=1 Tax=Cereibacter sphaeroides TaxID=1063 RepID=A0A2W5S5B4_CERSP|nr:MAG: hypothetical protein DI533_19590 [Cereibacter sphaeroides]
MTRAAFDNLFATVGALICTTPELRDFVDWPDAPAFPGVPALGVPAIPLITGLQAVAAAQTAPIVEAIKAVASQAYWQQTYSEAEVGRDFLNRYGWFELVGPTGHYLSDTMRAYIAFWGEGLHYPMHLHEAEELYYILAGSAEFHAAGQGSAILRPQDARHHASNQPHAMDTHAEPVLTLILWRGVGLDGNARMATA